MTMKIKDERYDILFTGPPDTTQEKLDELTERLDMQAEFIEEQAELIGTIMKALTEQIEIVDGLKKDNEKRKEAEKNVRANTLRQLETPIKAAGAAFAVPSEQDIANQRERIQAKKSDILGGRFFSKND